MKRFLIFFVLFLAGVSGAFATHYRAGEITYVVTNYLSYHFTITTYTTDIEFPPDADSVKVDFGDGTIQYAWRTNGPGLKGEPLGNDIKKNIYEIDHTYPGPLPYYLVSVTDPNRVEQIENINNAYATDQIQFYIEDTLMVFDPAFVGVNNSPILLNPPIDFGNVNEIFFHNPAAFDPDGDSLTFELIPSKAGLGTNVPSYVLPDQVLPGVDNNFSINQFTGEIVWDSPKKPGKYNVAILVREYRDGMLMGTVLRDMQIIVKQVFNKPPVIADVHDTCIIAGTLLTIEVTATDPDTGQRVTLTAVGGPFEATTTSPAIFVAQSNIQFATGTFQWQTVCDNVREQTYQVVFKAQDDYVSGSGPTPLTDLETWIIRIVAPAPENLQVAPNGNNFDLTWDSPYACNELATGKFKGFSVWRREGPNPFVIDTCTPGLDGRGYTRLADLVQTYSYSDSTGVRGKEYCYRVLAEFAEETNFGQLYNRVPSLPSNEACAQLLRDLPIITNVTVDLTDQVNGQITVKWVNPLAADLDTVQNPGPYTYTVYRAEGFTGTVNRIQVATTTSPNFSALDDTVFTDSGLNTDSMPYNYEVEFKSNGNLLGSTEIASSVFLTVGVNDRRLDLTWEENVPWLNDSFQVNKLIGGSYVPIDTVTTHNYTDTGLINDTLYCYKVQSIGRYTVAGLPDPLLNYSQEECQRPMDTVPPCPPVLSATNACSGISEEDACSAGPDELKNNLVWTNPNNTCTDDTRSYRIYYAEPGSPIFVLVDSVIGANDTTYRHSFNNSLAGCYKVTALDNVGNESDSSNVICMDNCPCYRLPNVFTPNADGQNDFYTPIDPYRFIAKVEMKIYNRWGSLVYETEDPDILWSGNSTKGSKPLAEDTYYYVCKVFEIRVDGVRESSTILSGYIHLIRGNGGSNPSNP